MADESNDQSAEDLLREMVGEEDESLVDLLQAGLRAQDFLATRTGKTLFLRLRENMRQALGIIVNPVSTAQQTEVAVQALRINFAALSTLTTAIAEGEIAGRQIVSG